MDPTLYRRAVLLGYAGAVSLFLTLMLLSSKL